MQNGRISQKYKMGAVSKGVANTLQPAKKLSIKSVSSCLTKITGMGFILF